MHQHGCQQQRKGEDLGRYVENILLKLRVFYQGNNGAVVEYLVGNLRVRGSRLTCAQLFSSTTPENSGGAENLAEKSDPDSTKFFCYMYEYSLRNPVWVAEITLRLVIVQIHYDFFGPQMALA